MNATSTERRWEWRLRVVDAHQIAPRFRRVIFTADHLDELLYEPGQALILSVPLADGTSGRRDYTIRGLDRGAGTLAIDFLLHGDTPTGRWVRSAAPGDELTAIGPRGRIVSRMDADWHLFCLDETGLPALAHLLEAMPADASIHAMVEVPDAADEQALTTAGSLELTWLHRHAIPPGPNTLVLDRLRNHRLLAGLGQAYLMGETSNVRSWRHCLVAAGLPKGAIASEGYWRPGRLGGHDHVDD
jgi:NADPH-dependent ferric siderophore reductase